MRKVNKYSKNKAPNKKFLFKISDDSMVNVGIKKGDLVFVKNQEEFISGDIVLAQVEGKLMVKRFISNDTPPFIYLKPESPKHKVIPFTEKVRLKGKVVSVGKSKKKG